MMAPSLEKQQPINPAAGNGRIGAWVGVKIRNIMFLSELIV